MDRKAAAAAGREVASVWIVWALLTLAVVVASGRLRLVTLHPHMRSVYAEVHGPFWLLRGWDYGWYTALAVQATVAIGAAALLWLLWRSRRRCGRPAFLFAFTVLGLTIVSGTFAAFARQMLFAFPLAWIASDLPRPHRRIATAAGSRRTSQESSSSPAISPEALA